MLVDDLIAEVASFFDRYDMVTLLQKEFPKALRTAHSYQKFNRDLGTLYIPSPTIVNGRVNVLTHTLPQMQHLLAIAGYTDFTSSVIGTDTIYYPGTEDGIVYRNLNEGYAQQDYYGFSYLSGYTRLKNTITLKGIPATTTLLELKAVLWPTFEYNPITLAYSTNSWILEEYPELLKQLLTVYAATVSQQSDVLASARKALREAREDFLNTFTGDIYGGQSIGSN